MALESSISTRGTYLLMLALLSDSMTLATPPLVSLKPFMCASHNTQGLVQKIKDRKKRKSQLSDRKSHANQQRMKTIATLASDHVPDKTPTSNKKRKKTNGTSQLGSRLRI